MSAINHHLKGEGGGRGEKEEGEGSLFKQTISERNISEWEGEPGRAPVPKALSIVTAR